MYIYQQPGIMGRMGKWSEDASGDWKIKEIEVYESFADMKTITKAKAKTAALAKLTLQERVLLGLT